MNQDSRQQTGRDAGRADNLVELFYEAWGAVHEGGEAVPADFPQELMRAWDDCRRRYPLIQVKEEDFSRHLAKSLAASEQELLSAFRQCHVRDLYLAFACSCKDPEAMKAFEAEYEGCLGGILSGFRLPADVGEDLKQEIYRKIFVGDGQSEKKILQFSGLGSLEAWVRVVASRCVLEHLRKRTRDPILAENVLVDTLCQSQKDLWNQMIKQQYQPDLKTCFREALQSLSRRERAVLKYRVLDALSVKEIARILGIHRVSVSRLLAQARSKLLQKSHEMLANQLQLPPPEVNSLVQLLTSGLDVSLSGVLKKPTDC